MIQTQWIGFSRPNNNKHYHLTESLDKVLLDEGGLYITQDGQKIVERHYGTTALSGTRELKQYPRGTIIDNYRQISAISTGELELIACRMKLGITPQCLAQLMGINIALEGNYNLSKLPRGTIIRFYHGESLEAEIEVTTENLPCRIPGDAITEITGHDGKYFAKSSYKYRGFVAKVVPTNIPQGKIEVGSDVKLLGVDPNDYIL